MIKRRSTMSSKNRFATTAVLLAGCLTAFAATAFAQSSQNQQGGQSQPGQQANKQQKPAEAGSSLDIPSSQPPANAEEDAAVKAFQAMPNTDLQKKYAESRYRPIVYSSLTFDYIQSGKADKAVEIGDKEDALKPDDVQTMAIL